MRKSGFFPALVYRELLLCKKSMVICLASMGIFSLIPILAILSLKYGNLAMLPQDILTGIRSNNDLMLTLYAVISPCMLILSVSEASVFDAQIKWDRFRRSTPVTPARLALGKYVFYLIVLAVSVALSVFVMWLCHALLGTPMTRTDFAVIMALIMVISILSVLAQVLIMTFRSVDKGMLAMIGCVAAVVFLLPNEWRTGFSVEWLLGMVEKLLPWSPAILGAALLLGFGLTVCVYKRRER